MEARDRSSEEDIARWHFEKEEERYPNIDDAISMITFKTLNSNQLNIIGLPLANVPTVMSSESQDKPNAEQMCEETGPSEIRAQEDEDQDQDQAVEVQEDKEEDSKLEEISLNDVIYTCFNRMQITIIFSIIVFIGFLGPMAGNIYIPALPLLQTEFNVGTTTINSSVSVFMAAFSVGPLIWGFYADHTGRKFLYILSLSLLVVVNILLATVPSNIVALFILRIFQALGSSSVIALGTGTVADIVSPKNRGKSIAYFMMGPNMGPILAPIIAGLILMRGEHWRWLFGFTSIMSFIALILVIVFLPETLRCIVGNGDPKWTDINTESKKPRLGFFRNIGIQKVRTEDPKFKKLYPRPSKPSLRMYWEITKYPPLLIVSMSSAMLFANYYGFTVTFSHFLQNTYNYSMLSVCIAYTCPGIAMLLGSQSGGHLSDYLRQHWLETHEKSTYLLEFRLHLQLWGILINTIGCIGYGWSIQKYYHVAVVFMFSAFSAFGLTWANNSTMTYISETMTTKVAAAIAVSSFLRNIGATLSSAIIIKLCQSMGIGWCFTGLGLCNIFSFLAIFYLMHSRVRKPAMTQQNV